MLELTIPSLIDTNISFKEPELVETNVARVCKRVCTCVCDTRALDVLANPKPVHTRALDVLANPKPRH